MEEGRNFVLGGLSRTPLFYAHSARINVPFYIRLYPLRLVLI